MCGDSLQRKRRDAVYCTAACKQFAHRRRKAASGTTAREAQISVRVPAVVTIRDVAQARVVSEQPEPSPATPFLV